MRTTASRFEVSYPNYGVIEHVSSKYEASVVAKNFCISNGFDYVEVFDRMAHQAKAELWKVNVSVCLQNENSTCYFVWEEIQKKVTMVVL